MGRIRQRNSSIGRFHGDNRHGRGRVTRLDKDRMTPKPIVAVGAARAYAEKIFGGPIIEQESNPTIPTTGAVVIDGNGDRVGLLIVNVGANTLYIGTQSNVSSSNGIQLASGGGSAAFDVTQDFTLPSRRFYGTTTNGSSAVYVLEILRVALTQPGAA